MMQAKEVARRFGAIEHAIGHAAQLCGKQQGMPMDLQDCIQQLDQQKGAVRQAMTRKTMRASGKPSIRWSPWATAPSGRAGRRPA